MKTKLTFIADTHHFSETLTDGGRQFRLRSGSDQKCLAETGALIDAAFDYISGSDTQAVMIAGDVSDDGELVSHLEFREKLYKLSEIKPVYLITATHDWCCDRNPRAYFGDSVLTDVPTLSHDELRKFYFDFGPGHAISEYITHLGVSSYVADLSDEVRLLAINDDQDGKGHAGYSDEHFDWIEQQIIKAKEDNKILIGMEHHLIMPHVHPLISGFGMCVGNREYVASRLADAGLKYMFVGHSHIQHVSKFTSKKGNTITQVNIGSLVGYPGSIVNVTVEDGNVDIDTTWVPTFNYHGEKETLPYLQKHLTDLVDRIIDGAASGDSKEFADRLDALGIHNDTIKKLHPVIKPFASGLSKMKVSDAYRILNTLTFGKVMNRKDAEVFWEKRVLDFVHEVVCDTMGGAINPHEKGSAYCNLVTQVVSVPSFFVKNNKVLNQLAPLAEAIVTGGEYNNRKTRL